MSSSYPAPPLQPPVPQPPVPGPQGPRPHGSRPPASPQRPSARRHRWSIALAVMIGTITILYGALQVGGVLLAMGTWSLLTKLDTIDLYPVETVPEEERPAPAAPMEPAPPSAPLEAPPGTEGAATPLDRPGILGHEWATEFPSTGEVHVSLTAATDLGPIYLTRVEATQGTYVGVLLSAENRTDLDTLVYPSFVTLRTPDGHVYEASLETAASEAPLVADPLPPSRAVTGLVVFDVPADIDLPACDIVISTQQGQELVLPLAPVTATDTGE